MSITIKRIPRVIYYYELELAFNEQNAPEDGNFLRELFQKIISLSKQKSSLRYREIGQRMICIQEIKFEPSEKKIIGKLKSVRTDVFPEILDMDTDQTRDIEAKESEGLVETSHFIIDYKKKKPVLAMEFNQFGGKVIDLVSYIDLIGVKEKLLQGIVFKPMVRDDLSKFKERMNRISRFIVRVHKDNLAEIKKHSKKLATSLEAANAAVDSDYIEVEYKLDYTKKTSSETPVRRTVFGLINWLATRKDDAILFEKLRVDAEDIEKNNALEAFDLLVDKVSSRIKVERKPQHKVLVSDDMFRKMKSELTRLKL